ncbi:MAG: hypothetical protein ABI614_23710, partial [Planctomycetota bacterium]
NGDGSVSPVDVLMIINLLNSNLPGTEGENSVLPLPTPPTPVAAAPTSAAVLTQRTLYSKPTGTDAFFDSRRDTSEHHLPFADTSADSKNPECFDLDELIDGFLAFRPLTASDDIFADWPTM